jgi:hypothetical protein
MQRKAAHDGCQAMRHLSSKSQVAEEALGLIMHMRAATACEQLEQLGNAIGVFVTLKCQSDDKRGGLNIQSLLQARDLGASWIQAARDAFWRGLLAAVSGRMCSVREFDLTANCLDQGDEVAVIAILNKLVADGVSKIGVGHAFLKYSSIAVKVVNSLIASCGSHYLHHLNLTGTLIGNNGAAALSRALGHSSLTWPHELHLSKCNISDAGCIALVDALLQFLRRSRTQIGILNLSENSITDEAMAAVAPVMMQFVELHVSACVSIMKSNWKMLANRSVAIRNESTNVSEQHSFFSIQELNLECNVISDIGLKFLTSPLTCKSILKHQVAAFTFLVEEQKIPSAEVAELLKLATAKPILETILIGGNLCAVPSEGSIVHICRANEVFAQECSSALARTALAPQSVQVLHGYRGGESF